MRKSPTKKTPSPGARKTRGKPLKTKIANFAISLDKTAKSLTKVAARKAGAIQFDLTGREAGDYTLNVDARRNVSAKQGKPTGKPKIRIRGDGQQIRMVLEGKRDARKAFLAGKIRVRGDIRYLERLLADAGLMKPAR